MLDALLLRLSAVSDVRLFPTFNERTTWSAVEHRCAALCEARALRAMEEGIPPLKLSDAADLFEGGRRDFVDNQIARRELLKAIALHCLAGGGNIFLFARMADLIYAICEEAFWGPPEAYASFESPRACASMPRTQ